MGIFVLFWVKFVYKTPYPATTPNSYQLSHTHSNTLIHTMSGGMGGCVGDADLKRKLRLEIPDSFVRLKRQASGDGLLGVEKGAMSKEEDTNKASNNIDKHPLMDKVDIALNMFNPIKGISDDRLQEKLSNMEEYKKQLNVLKELIGDKIINMDKMLFKLYNDKQLQGDSIPLRRQINKLEKEGEAMQAEIAKIDQKMAKVDWVIDGIKIWTGLWKSWEMDKMSDCEDSITDGSSDGEAD